MESANDPIPPFVVHTRNQTGIRYSDGTSALAQITLADGSVVGFDKIATNSGFAAFTQGDSTYYVVNRASADGSRYHDLAIKSLKTGEEVATYEYPTGEATNYMSAKAATVNADGSVNIFQFVPGNSLTMFRLIAGSLYEENGFEYLLSASEPYTANVLSCELSGHVEVPDSVVVDGISYSVIRIEGGAFANNAVTSLVLPASITEIEGNAFSGCSKLTTLVSLSATPPTCGTTAFSGIDLSACTLYVPKDGFFSYWTADVWKNFTNMKILTMAESLTLDEKVSVEYGGSLQLTATISPEDAIIKDLIWETSDAKIVSVDENGLIKGVAEGKATITARTIDGSNLSATCEVTVGVVKVGSIELSQNEVEVEFGGTFDLTCTVSPDDADIKTVSWESDNDNVATVTVNRDGSVTVTGVGVGSAKITATTTDGSNLSDTCEVTVTTILVDSIAISETSVEIKPYEMKDFTCEVYPETAVDKSVTWSLDDESVALMRSNSDGSVSVIGLVVGKTVLRVAANDGSGVSAECEINVVDEYTGIESVNADANSLVEFYNLQGVKVENPENGIFVKKQGGKVVKMVLRKK